MCICTCTHVLHIIDLIVQVCNLAIMDLLILYKNNITVVNLS